MTKTNRRRPHEQHEQHEQHNQRNRRRRSWKLWVIIALMLTAMAAYLISMDESWRPFRSDSEHSAPGAAR